MVFSAYDNNYVVPNLVISNLTTGTPSSTINLNVSHYLLSTANQYQLSYTCSTGNTLMDVRFQNYVTASEQVVWTNNQWFIAESLIGPQGLTGPTGPTGPSGPVAGTNTQVIYNNSGAPAGNSSLTFNQSTGTLTAFALTVTNAASIAGNLNMNYQNITNLTTANFNVSPSTPFVATGHVSSFYNATTDRTYYVFNSTASGSITVASSAAVEYFALGGGAGGGADGNAVNSYASGAGGGAGGLQTNSGVTATLSEYFQIGTAGTIPAGTYVINVGSGGAGGVWSVAPTVGLSGYGFNGQSTTFGVFGGATLVTAVGGGGGAPNTYGGSVRVPGLSGGCGGGGGGNYGTTEPGGSGTQGFGGGSQIGTNYTAGGGGGIGALGGSGTSSLVGGIGGNGLVYPASGTGSTGYGAGGGGAAYTSGSVGGSGGSAGGSVLGGVGGGGGYQLRSGGNAVANTGSGGGGGGNSADQQPNHATGGNGAGGIFIISFAGTAGNTGTGAINVNTGGNLQVTANSNIVLSPSSGGVTITGLTPAISVMTGFYNLVYNPSTGQLAYYRP